MLMLTAYNILLSKYSGQEDIIIGSPIAGRGHADLEKLIGMFVNTLALRNFLNANKTVQEFLSEVKENALNAYENQDYQFEELVEKLEIRRDLSRNPLFDTMFALQNTNAPNYELEGLKFKSYKFEKNISKFDLTLNAIEIKDGIILEWEYCTKLFNEETINKLAEHYIKIVETMIINPEIKLSDIEMILPEEKEKSLQLFSYSFDGFVTSFFTPIISGAKIVLLSEEEMKDITKIKEIIVKNQITHFISVPLLYQAIIDQLSKDEADSLKVITLAGDKIPNIIIEKTISKNKDIEIVCEYGVTEAAVMSTIYRHQEKDPLIKIGSPIANTKLYVLDKNRRLQPVGVPGELCISGSGVARGYLNRPDLTDEKFIDNPFKLHEKMYCTGDLVRWLKDGTLEFLGRIDHQVKIRGFRIELGEIENQLLLHEEISDVIVVAEKDKNDNKYLIAYFVATKELTVPELKTYLKINYQIICCHLISFN